VFTVEGSTVVSREERVVADAVTVVCPESGWQNTAEVG
jgi:hypothetical protein